MEKTQEKSDSQIKELTDRLEQGIKELFNSERYQQYLRTVQKFHSYSVNNTVLILMQKPEATHVAGYHTWESLHRQVRKGEKGIRIFAPSKRTYKKMMDVVDPGTGEVKKNPDGTPARKLVDVSQVSFRAVPVFDISQTEGEELPDITRELKGDIVNYPVMLLAIRHTAGIPLRFESLSGQQKGYYHTVDNEIVLRDGMSELQTIKTAIHETAHSILHSGTCEKDRQTKEVEAESVAFVVCQHFGLDTSDYSFGYVAGWSSERTMPELKSSLQTIQQTSDKLIKQMEMEMHQIAKDIDKCREKVGDESPLSNVAVHSFRR